MAAHFLLGRHATCGYKQEITVMAERQTWGLGEQPLRHSARNLPQTREVAGISSSSARQCAALRELNMLTLMRTFMDDPRLWQHTPRHGAG
jgi:hypothetical protein